MALVACAATLTWAARYVWESQQPAIAVARGLQSRTTGGRLEAARELGRLANATPGFSIAALRRAADDDAVEVRVAVAEALGSIGAEAIRKGNDHDGVRGAVSTLLRLLKDQDPLVQRAAALSLSGLGTVAARAEPLAIDIDFGPVKDAFRRYHAPIDMRLGVAPVDRVIRAGSANTAIASGR
jgi:hypothetical protein